MPVNSRLFVSCGTPWIWCIATRRRARHPAEMKKMKEKSILRGASPEIDRRACESAHCRPRDDRALLVAILFAFVLAKLAFSQTDYISGIASRWRPHHPQHQHLASLHTPHNHLHSLPYPPLISMLLSSFIVALLGLCSLPLVLASPLALSKRFYSTVPGWSSLGCMAEPSGGARVLSVKISEDSNLTQASCVASCSSAGYVYAG